MTSRREQSLKTIAEATMQVKHRELPQNRILAVVHSHQLSRLRRVSYCLGGSAPPRLALGKCRCESETTKAPSRPFGGTQVIPSISSSAPTSAPAINFARVSIRAVRWPCSKSPIAVR